MIDFGENVMAKSSNIQKDTACSLGLCRHNSICIPKNTHNGFICDCSNAKGYEGEFCERKILKCSYGIFSSFYLFLYLLIIDLG